MLAEVGGHQSADELVAALRAAGYPHARTTVYNALQDLARAGLVREAPVAAGALRYEADTSPHYHFVCRNCGLIINVPISEDVHVPEAPPIEGVEVDTVDIIYRGTCQQCEEQGSGNGGRAIDLREEADLREGTDLREGAHTPPEQDEQEQPEPAMRGNP
jgi:Fur family ferric uptake transcriptional regulator/Fur family peroxide stress response transcriptional regulator